MQKTLNEDTDGEDDNGCDGGSGDVQEEHGSRSTEPGDAGGFCCNVEKNFNAAHLPHPHCRPSCLDECRTPANVCQ